MDDDVLETEDYARLLSCDKDGESYWLCPQVDATRRTTIKGVDLSQTNEFIASTDVEARDGDIIDQESWRLAQYRRNPIVLKEHYGEVVGRSLKTWVAENQLRQVIQWDDHEANEDGQLIAHQHRTGFRHALSVRWRAGKLMRRDKLGKSDKRFSEGRKVQGMFGTYRRVGFVHYNSVLIESSSVGVPSDPRALQVRALGQARSQIDDSGAARTLEEQVLAVLTDKRTFEDEGYRDQVRDLMLHLIRTDRAIKTAARALGLTEPIPARDKPEFTPSPDGLDFIFPPDQE